jgi:hypothetical protein
MTVALALAGAVSSTASRAPAADVDGSEAGLFGSAHPEAAGRFMVNVMTMTPVEQRPPLVGGGPGVRAGVSLQGLYAGLSFVDFLSEGGCFDSYPGSCSSSHAASYGLEVGYGRTFFGRLMVRGLLGVGDRIVTSDGTSGMCSNSQCSTVLTKTWHASRGDLYLAPAVLVALALGPVLVGADATVVYMPTTGAPNGTTAPFVSLMPGAQLGLRL